MVNINNLNFINTNTSINGSSGGAIACSNSFIGFGNCNFSNNNMVGAGGAIASYTSFISIYKSTFTNNTAENGGAIYFYNSSSFMLNNIFQNNIASNAGAIYINNSDVRIKSSNFKNNKATYDLGGAIINTNSNLTITNVSFNNNSAEAGGAITINNNETTHNIIIINESNFENNKATYDLGGAIYSYSNYITLNLSNNNFTNNYASHAGGTITIASYNSTVINLNNNKFTDNLAGRGAAIYLVGSSSDDGIVNLYKCEFINNTAIYGGAVSIWTSHVKIDDCKFYNNTVLDRSTSSYFRSEGAGLYIMSSTVEILNSDFINNHAKIYDGYNNQIDGGAIAASYSKVKIADCAFEDNNVTNYGGAILSTGSILNISGTEFYENSAGKSGGAIYSQYSNIIINGSYFEYNNASIKGGAIYSYMDNMIMINHTGFYVNTVLGENLTNSTTSGGGAIYVYDGNLTINDAYFELARALGNSSNKLSCIGGAIYLNKATLNVYNISFYNTKAVNNGATIYAFNSALNLNYTVLLNQIENNSLISTRNSILNLTYSRIINKDAPFISLSNSTGNLDYNWWGTNNNPNPFIKSNLNSSVKLDNWVIMTLNSNTTNITVNDYINLITSLNHYTDGNRTFNMTNDVATDSATLKITVTKADGNTTTINRHLFEPVDNFHPRVISSGTRIFTSTVDNQTLTLNITVNKMTNMSTILNALNTWYFYGNNTYNGTLKDSNGNNISKREISLNLTRISSGAWKVYNVTTGADGKFTLPITLSPGQYTLKASFNGDDDYYSSLDNANFTVYDYILKVSNLNATYGDKISFNGTLTYANNTPLVNKIVKVQLVRLSDGARKIYNLTTDENGFFSLPINLSPGNYLSLTYTTPIQFYSDKYICISNGSADNRTVTSTYTYINSTNIYGSIYDYTFKEIPNQNVTIELTRLSNGLSKNYTVTTDNDGSYTLPLNLTSGYYKLHTFYAGTSVYQPCAYQMDFPFRIVNY